MYPSAVYWSKVWYADLGDEVCKKLSSWPQEQITLEACYESNGYLKRYYLSNNSGLRSSITFISSTTLSHPMVMDSTNSNSGGWAKYALNGYLNTRVYNAFPDKWKQLLKQVTVKSSTGEKIVNDSGQIQFLFSNSDCYIFIPSISEVYPDITSEPYPSEGSIISHFTNNASRACKNMDDKYVTYWTRSPNVSYANYIYRIMYDGNVSSLGSPND